MCVRALSGRHAKGGEREERASLQKQQLEQQVCGLKTGCGQRRAAGPQRALGRVEGELGEASALELEDEEAANGKAKGSSHRDR